MSKRMRRSLDSSVTVREEPRYYEIDETEELFLNIHEPKVEIKEEPDKEVDIGETEEFVNIHEPTVEIQEEPDKEVDFSYGTSLQDDELDEIEESLLNVKPMLNYPIESPENVGNSSRKDNSPVMIGSPQHFYTFDNKLFSELSRFYDSRSFQCNMCTLVCTYKKDMTKHLGLTHKVRLYVCTVCHNKYTTKKDVELHIRYAHLGREKPFRCNLCDARFVLRACLFKHIDQNHKGPYKNKVKRKHMNNFSNVRDNRNAIIDHVISTMLPLI